MRAGPFISGMVELARGMQHVALPKPADMVCDPYRGSGHRDPFPVPVPVPFLIRHGNINADRCPRRELGETTAADRLCAKYRSLRAARRFRRAVFSAVGSVRGERVALITAGGALLSIAIELTQYFDAARYTAASDVYANVLGTFLGAAAAVLAVPPVSSRPDTGPKYRQRSPL